jgi:DNA-binding NtrC family response regulator
MSVVTAGSAQEALAVAADPRVHIDVVVMDIVLPDSWGAQVALENTLFRPDAKVIFISGHSRQDAILEASASADDVHFLAKPFGVDELADLIRKVMDEPSKIEESPGEER